MSDDATVRMQITKLRDPAVRAQRRKDLRERQEQWKKDWADDRGAQIRLLIIGFVTVVVALFAIPHLVDAIGFFKIVAIVGWLVAVWWIFAAQWRKACLWTAGLAVLCSLGFALSLNGTRWLLPGFALVFGLALMLAVSYLGRRQIAYLFTTIVVMAVIYVLGQLPAWINPLSLFSVYLVAIIVLVIFAFLYGGVTQREGEVIGSLLVIELIGVWLVEKEVIRSVPVYIGGELELDRLAFVYLAILWYQVWLLWRMSERPEVDRPPEVSQEEATDEQELWERLFELRREGTKVIRKDRQGFLKPPLTKLGLEPNQVETLSKDSAAVGRFKQYGHEALVTELRAEYLKDPGLMTAKKKFSAKARRKYGDLLEEFGVTEDDILTQ